MKIKKVIKYIFIAIPLLFLLKWGIESAMYNSNKTPDINPHPKDKLRIYGNFPFENDVDINITILYINKNPECDQKFWLAGTQFPQKAKKVFSTDTKNQFFESTVYLDYFSPGVCKWKAHRIYAYLISKKDHLVIYGERFLRTKKDVVVTWESNWMKLYEDEKMQWGRSLNHLYQADKILHRNDSAREYENIYLNNMRLPSDIKIGTIDYENLSSSDEAFNLECIKRHSDTNVIKTYILCNGYDKEKVTNITGYDLKLNISNLQDEIRFDFMDKGWK